MKTNMFFKKISLKLLKIQVRENNIKNYIIKNKSNNTMKKIINIINDIGDEKKSLNHFINDYIDIIIKNSKTYLSDTSEMISKIKKEQNEKELFLYKHNIKNNKHTDKIMYINNNNTLLINLLKYKLLDNEQFKKIVYDFYNINDEIKKIIVENYKDVLNEYLDDIMNALKINFFNILDVDYEIKNLLKELYNYNYLNEDIIKKYKNFINNIENPEVIIELNKYINCDLYLEINEKLKYQDIFEKAKCEYFYLYKPYSEKSSINVYIDDNEMSLYVRELLDKKEKNRSAISSLFLKSENIANLKNRERLQKIIIDEIMNKIKSYENDFEKIFNLINNFYYILQVEIAYKFIKSILEDKLLNYEVYKMDFINFISQQIKIENTHFNKNNIKNLFNEKYLFIQDFIDIKNYLEEYSISIDYSDDINVRDKERKDLKEMNNKIRLLMLIFEKNIKSNENNDYRLKTMFDMKNHDLYNMLKYDEKIIYIKNDGVIVEKMIPQLLKEIDYDILKEKYETIEVIKKNINNEIIKNEIINNIKQFEKNNLIIYFINDIDEKLISFKRENFKDFLFNQCLNDDIVSEIYLNEIRFYQNNLESLFLENKSINEKEKNAISYYQDFIIANNLSVLKFVDENEIDISTNNKYNYIIENYKANNKTIDKFIKYIPIIYEKNKLEKLNTKLNIKNKIIKKL